MSERGEGDSTVPAATEVALGFLRFQPGSQCCRHPRETAPMRASLSSSLSVCLSLSLCLIISLTLTHTHTHTHTHIVSLSQNCGHFLNSFDFRTISLEGRTQGWPKPFPFVKKKGGWAEIFRERELGVLCLREVQRCMLMAF